MRVNLETNVLLSRLVSPHSAPETIHRAWREGRSKRVTAAVHLIELHRGRIGPARILTPVVFCSEILA